MDDAKFFKYLQKSIMKIYLDAALMKGKWVVIKCDNGPGRLNPNLLPYLQYQGFLFYPGVPNTTVVSQEMDQSYGYGPFQLAIRTNLQLLIDECICKDSPRTFSPWIVGHVVFGRCNPETGLLRWHSKKDFPKCRHPRLGRYHGQTCGVQAVVVCCDLQISWAWNPRKNPSIN